MSQWLCEGRMEVGQWLCKRSRDASQWLSAMAIKAWAVAEGS